MENDLGGVDGAGRVLSPAVRIQPQRAWEWPNWREMWDHRELLYYLVWRDFKVRYKQTVLGLTWAVVSPVLTMLLFSVIFGYLAKLPSDGIPYPVFTFAALLPWQLFIRALGATSTSLINSQALLTKVYFPRLFLPISGLMTGMADFAIGVLVLAGLMLYYDVRPSWGIIVLPAFVLLLLITALAAGLWLASLSVRYRDVQQIVPFLMQLWLYASPIAYATSLIPANLRAFYALNPMVGVVDGFRWALLSQAAVPGLPLFVSSVVMVVMLVTGLLYFRRIEDTFADVV